MTTSVMVATPLPRARELAAEIEAEDVRVVAVVPPEAPIDLVAGIEAIVVPAARTVLTPALISACDRAGVRIVALGGTETRLLGRLGLPAALPADASGWEVVAALRREPAAPSSPGSPAARHRVIAVWGPQGSPGRSTLAIQLAVELARGGRATALVDADSVAPSLALLLGLSDDSPGIAAACRRAELGGLDGAELTRLSTTISTSAGDIEVLPGINRSSRWPELSSTRVRETLRACREWIDDTVVDVGAAFDADDEVTNDLAGPRRHAATSATLQEADAVIAVASADPVGISRFLRDNAELRRLSSPSPVAVVVNQVRPGPLGIDARSQVRRTLERFAGITDVAFVPFDQRAADAALLHARPIADVAPRSSLVAAVRRLSASLAVEGADAATDGSSRGSSRVVRRLRSALAAREG